MTIGKVFLIGAGPGDPKLITIRGMECLKQADVVVYDRLASPRLLEYASGNAEKIYVGKLPDRHTLAQEEINHLLVMKAREGKKVARLKGGDPFVFGRGGEEAEELFRRGIPFDVVPGITSAIAAPAYAGIPVTHRSYASSFHVITGHEDIGKEQSSMDWELIARMEGTLIFLMGISNIQYIAEKLMEYGQPGERPVAVIQWGTTLRQKTVLGTLKDIAEEIRKQGITPPAIILVGEVAQLRKELSWLEKRPLWGKKVIVTRSREQASNLSMELEELGAEVMELPTIRIEPLDDYSQLDEEISRIPRYKWVIFTSVNGVGVFFSRLKSLGKDARVLGPVRICAIGPATRSAVEDKGILADYMPGEYRAEAVAEGLSRLVKPGEAVLIPRAEVARDVLENTLRGMGVLVKVVPVYRTVVEDLISGDMGELMSSGHIDWITFTSSSTVKNFVHMVKGMDVKLDLDAVKAACIGPITADTAMELGISATVVAQEYTIAGLVEAIVEWERGSQG